MQEYRAYVIGPDGHIQRRFDLLCADDDAAKERARQLVNGHDLELWQFDRVVAKFSSMSHADQALRSLRSTPTTCGRSSKAEPRNELRPPQFGGLFRFPGHRWASDRSLAPVGDGEKTA
jgi:hypothetical protein